MSELKIIPLKVNEAYYDASKCSIIIIGSFEQRQVQSEISKDCFYFGTRTESEIHREMEKTAKMIIGKTVKIACSENDFN